MAILFIADASNDTIAHYDEVIKLLKAAGQEHPTGRLHHVAVPKGDGYQVVDVWESQAAFDHFFQTTFGPIAQQVGVSMEQKMETYPVHNIVKGA